MGALPIAPGIKPSKLMMRARSANWCGTGVTVATGVDGMGDEICGVTGVSLALTWVLVVVPTGISPAGSQAASSRSTSEKRMREVFKEVFSVAYFNIGILMP